MDFIGKYTYSTLISGVICNQSRDENQECLRQLRIIQVGGVVLLGAVVLWSRLVPWSWRPRNAKELDWTQPGLTEN